MSREKGYQPSEEEIKKAEGTMTEEQKGMSKEREGAVDHGRKLGRKEIQDLYPEQHGVTTAEAEIDRLGLKIGDKVRVYLHAQKGWESVPSGGILRGVDKENNLLIEEEGTIRKYDRIAKLEHDEE